MSSELLVDPPIYGECDSLEVKPKIRNFLWNSHWDTRLDNRGSKHCLEVVQHNIWHMQYFPKTTSVCESVNSTYIGLQVRTKTTTKTHSCWVGRSRRVEWWVANTRLNPWRVSIDETTPGSPSTCVHSPPKARRRRTWRTERSPWVMQRKRENILYREQRKTFNL